MKFELKEVDGLSESDQTHWKIRILTVNQNGETKSPAMDSLEEWSKNQKADFNKIIKVMKRVGQTTRVKDPKHVKKAPTKSMRTSMKCERIKDTQDSCFSTARKTKPQSQSAPIHFGKVKAIRTKLLKSATK